MGPVTKGLKAMSHPLIQIFCVGQGGGVVQGGLLENSLNNVFFSFSSAYFIVYRGGQIVYQWGFFRGNYFFQVSGGFPSLIQGFHHFPGDPTFSRVGIQMQFSIETHITCEFSGGVGKDGCFLFFSNEHQ